MCIRKVLLVVAVQFFSFSLCLAESGYTFKVGLILTLTSEWAEYGEAQANAIKLAQNNYPNKFSNIRFITEDTGYNAQKTIAAFNNLVDQEKVDLVFVWGVEPARIIATIAERRKVPLAVSAIIPNASVGKEYVFRTINYDKQYALKLLEYLKDKQAKKIGIIKSQLAYHNILVDALVQHAPKGMEIEIIADVLPNEREFRTYAAKLKNRELDYLGLFLSPSQIITFCQDARAYLPRFSLFGPQTLQSKKLLKQTHGAIKDAIYVHNLVNTDFHQQYLKRYEIDSQIPWGANAYDFVVLVANLFSDLQEKPSKKEVLNKFRQLKEGRGVGGDYKVVSRSDTGMYFDYHLGIHRVS